MNLIRTLNCSSVITEWSLIFLFEIKTHWFYKSCNFFRMFFSVFLIFFLQIWVFLFNSASFCLILLLIIIVLNFYSNTTLILIIIFFCLLLLLLDRWIFLFEQRKNGVPEFLKVFNKIKSDLIFLLKIDFIYRTKLWHQLIRYWLDKHCLRIFYGNISLIILVFIVNFIFIFFLLLLILIWFIHF